MGGSLGKAKKHVNHKSWPTPLVVLQTGIAIVLFAGLCAFVYVAYSCKRNGSRRQGNLCTLFKLKFGITDYA